MNGMTAQERLEDISRRSGFSIDICRRVLNAESESAIDSLKKGERVNLIGRVTLRPEMRHKVGLNGNIENIVKVKSLVSSSLESALVDVKEFKTDSNNEDTNDSGIRLKQIPSLL